MISKPTLVLGASPNPDRVSYDAVLNLIKRDIPVYAVGKKEYDLGYIKITTEFPENIKIHTVALYLGARHQSEYYKRIIDLKPERIIFNPGTENMELETLARDNGIEVIDGCLLVMLKTGTF